MKVLDTTVLIDILRGKDDTKYLVENIDNPLTTQINIYEILVGLFQKKISSSQIKKPSDIFNSIGVLPLDDDGLIISAEICASLIKEGNEIPDMDCITAGIALSKGITTIITKNKKHFERIKGIKVETY